VYVCEGECVKDRQEEGGMVALEISGEKRKICGLSRVDLKRERWHNQFLQARLLCLKTKRKKNLTYIANPRMRVCPGDTNSWILRSESSPMALRIDQVKGVKWTVVVLR
jgi:hypothetical protein